MSRAELQPALKRRRYEELLVRGGEGCRRLRQVGEGHGLNRQHILPGCTEPKDAQPALLMRGRIPLHTSEFFANIQAELKMEPWPGL